MRGLLSCTFLALALALALALVSLHASAAAACSCNATAVADVVRHMDVVSEAVVGPARPEEGGALSSPVAFAKPLRGPLAAKDLRVFWRKPDGSSCDTIDLRPGRWLLFLSWSGDGRLYVTRCDQHSKRLGDDKRAKQARKELMAHLTPVKNEADAIAAAALAVRRMLTASVAGQPGGEVAPKTAPGGEVDLAPLDRAIVTALADGSFVVRWSKHPPAGFAVEAEVRVTPDGVAQVVRADASYSSD